jgi:acyl-CoA synthetase (AMP-forming)/AMP-acid ligase II
MKSPKVITALNAVTATTTSNQIPISSFKRVAILYRRANHSAGSTAFTVTAGFAEDAGTDPTMTAYNMLIDNLTNTNAQMPTRINSKTLSADGDAMVWMDPACPATHIAITATETTDGTHSAFVIGWED